MSTESPTGKMRNVSISSITSPDAIQMYLNQALRVDASVHDILKGFKAIDPGLSEKDLRKIMQNPDGYLFYARLSPMDKVMFIASEKNMKLLDSDFSAWYKRTLKRFGGKNQEAFKQLFEHLLHEPNTSRATVELKLMLPYLTRTGKRSMFKELVKEYAGDVKGVGGRPKALAKIQANMFKRGFLSDGGTTQPMHPEVLRWAASNHPITES